MQMSYPLMMALLGGLKAQGQNRGQLVDIGGGYRAYSEPHWSQQLTNTLAGAAEGGIGAAASEKLADIAQARKLESLKEELSQRDNAALRREAAIGGFESPEAMGAYKRQQRAQETPEARLGLLDRELQMRTAAGLHKTALSRGYQSPEKMLKELREERAAERNRDPLRELENELDLRNEKTLQRRAMGEGFETVEGLMEHARAQRKSQKTGVPPEVQGWVQRIIDTARNTGRTPDVILHGSTDNNFDTGLMDDIPPELYPAVRAELRRRFKGADTYKPPRIQDWR